MKHTIIVFAFLLIAGCGDFGIAPVLPDAPAAQWKKIESFKLVKSGWLNFISVQAYYDKPDSAKIIIDFDGRVAFAQELLGGTGSFIARFYFEPGYVSALPSDPHVQFYIKVMQ
jgi:hypothetical protein